MVLVRSGRQQNPVEALGPPPGLPRLLMPLVLLLPPSFAADEFLSPTLGPVGTALLLAGAVAGIVLRRRFPRSAFAAVLVLAVLGTAFDGPFPALVVALAIVVFSVARHTDRRTALVVTAVGALTVALAGSLLQAAEWGALRSFIQLAAAIGFAGAAGDADRSRRAYIGAVTERARRAEESLESEARSRVSEERLRIARDLHDVMAHQIAVINLHAGAASQALHQRPEDAERSLATIREAARTVLGEIESLLRVLRADDSAAGPTGPAAPVPGLAELDTLVAGFRRLGLRVDLRTLGMRVPVPQEVDIVAYRVIQEGLTNAHKHGSDGSALLQVEYGEDELQVSVTNPVAAAPGPGAAPPGGHGLVGARERVAAVQGSLQHSFGPGPVHRLTARLPLRTGQHLHPMPGPNQQRPVDRGSPPAQGAWT